MSATRLSAGRPFWVLFASLLAGLAVELLIPKTPLSSFLLVPVVASALLGRPALTAVLSLMSLALALPAQLWLDYPATQIAVRSLLLVTAGIIAIGLAAYVARTNRERDAALSGAQSSKDLLRNVIDAMLDPQILFQPVRDSGGRITDFTYREVNRAATALGVITRDMLGQSLAQNFPNIAESGLLGQYIHCSETGEPVALDDFEFFNAVLGQSRHYDIRGARTDDGCLSMTFRDVTERHRYRERLAASERRYRLLAANSSDLVTHVRDGRFVWTSPAAEEILGAPAPYWVGRQLQEIFPPEALSASAARLATLAQGGKVKERVQVVSVDGVTHWVDLHARPFYDDDGRQDGFSAALRLADDEVAAERAAEEARRQQVRADALYRRSMESAAVGMCLIDTEGGFIDVNDALCAFFGYDAETLKRKTWQELTAPDHLQADLSRFNDVLAGRLQSYRMTKQYVHAKGHLIWGDLSVSCITDEHGKVERVISQIVDITAKTEADERNRTLARQLQQQSELVKAELDSAAGYMASIMPRGLGGPVAVSSLYLPSRALGGDCFDYTWIDDDHLIVYLIDVSGHGIEPALLAVSLQNLMRSGTFTTQTMIDPESVLTELNRLFQMDQQSEHYFTIWYGVYQLSSRTLRYASAGAPPAYAISATTGKSPTPTELTTNCTPVGVFTDTEFTAATFSVPPGCRILIFSDGASEMVLASGEQLGLRGLRELYGRLAGSPNWSLDDFIEQLRALAPAGVFEDDCSLIQLAIE